MFAAWLLASPLVRTDTVSPSTVRSCGPLQEVRTALFSSQRSSIRQRRQNSRPSSMTLRAISSCVPSMITTGRRSGGSCIHSSLNRALAA